MDISANEEDDNVSNGFVEMATAEGSQAAIDALDGSNVDGRALTVNVAKERSR